MTEQKSLMMLNHYEALKDYIDKGFVFKKCQVQNFYSCLVILQKPLENFESNETRNNIVDSKFAKFRCNGLITIAIYDLLNEKFIDSLIHCYVGSWFQQPITYKVGKLSLPHYFNGNIDIVCAAGIHYFLTLEAALNYVNGKITQIFENKDLWTYTENGRKTVI